MYTIVCMNLIDMLNERVSPQYYVFYDFMYERLEKAKLIYDDRNYIIGCLVGRVGTQGCRRTFCGGGNV